MKCKHCFSFCCSEIKPGDKFIRMCGEIMCIPCAKEKGIKTSEGK